MESHNRLGENFLKSKSLCISSLPKVHCECLNCVQLASFSGEHAHSVLSDSIINHADYVERLKKFGSEKNM